MVQISYQIGINYNETDPTPEEISNYKSFVDSHFCSKIRATLTCDSSHVVSQGMNSIMSFIYYSKCDESNKVNIFHIHLTLDPKRKCSDIHLSNYRNLCLTQQEKSRKQAAMEVLWEIDNGAQKRVCEEESNFYPNLKQNFMYDEK